MAVALAVYTAEWNLGAGWTGITPWVISASGGGELTGNRDNALAFGDSSDTKATVTVTDFLASSVWQRQAIRLTFSINGSPAVSFAGIMVKRTRNSLDQTMTFECVGYAELIRTTKAYSPLLNRRPIATKTTASSVEDPANINWRGGLINYLWWQAGGRPLEQSSTYPTAIFYYSCDQALIAPLWSWTAGEDAWAESLKLAQASGGQCYQGLDGVVRYEQPYGIADATSIYTFDENVYGLQDGVTEDTTTDQLVTQISCTYVSRDKRAMQTIVEETTPRILQIGDTQTIVIEPQWPIFVLDTDASGNLKAECFTVAFPWFGTPVLGTDYTVAYTLLAQQITLTIVNLSGRPITLYAYRLTGIPIVAGPQGNVTIGSGTAQRTIADSVYIQNEHDARRLCNLTMLFYGTARPVRTITNCVYDPNRTVGEVVGLTVARWGLSAAPHIILKIAHDDTGLVSAYDLIDAAGLPIASDYYQVGPTYAVNKKLTV
jgi:hypothetical protein